MTAADQQRAIQHRPLQSNTEIISLFQLPNHDPIQTIDLSRYEKSSAMNNYRNEWIWVAVDTTPTNNNNNNNNNETVLCFVIWWGLPKGSHPLAIDHIYVHPSLTVPGKEKDRIKIVSDLIQTAHSTFKTEESPEYHIFVQPDWKQDSVQAQAIEWRKAVMAEIGNTDVLERYNYEWIPTTTTNTVQVQGHRLKFKPEPEDEKWIEIFERVAQGTLDSNTKKELLTMTPKEQAIGDLEGYKQFQKGNREWWRLAYTVDTDEVVGLMIPSHNGGAFVVGYLGVVPEFRGLGYVVDLLNELTRFLVVEQGAELVKADTDVVNRPMAKAFEKVGFKATKMRIVISAP